MFFNLFAFLFPTTHFVFMVLSDLWTLHTHSFSQAYRLSFFLKKSPKYLKKCSSFVRLKYFVFNTKGVILFDTHTFLSVFDNQLDTLNKLWRSSTGLAISNVLYENKGYVLRRIYLFITGTLLSGHHNTRNCFSSEDLQSK